MAAQSALAALDDLGTQHSPIRSSRVVLDYWALTKPEITFLITVTTAAGFWMGTATALPDFPWLSFFHALLGTAMVAGGAATLNQLVELPYDARMRRTARRPLVTGRIAPSQSFWFGVALSICGVTYLAISTNPLAACLAALTLHSYLFVYTPLKRRTPLCTLVGALPGAVGPLIGWAAARGRLDAGAWALFAIVFLWQFPHFTPIAWMYRDDYAAAGYLVLPQGERRTRFVMWQTLVAAAALVVVSQIPTLIGLTGFAYFIGALALGVTLLHYSVRFARRRTNFAARQLLLVSILYIPALFGLLMLDKL
jgi:protoheme IX farnesyltransferase